MICVQCNQPVILDMASETLPPWCQRCGADIRDALYGAKPSAAPVVQNFAATLPAAAPSASTFARKPKSSRDAKSGPVPAVSPNAALFLGVGLLMAAVLLAAFKLLT
jgi:hypothetical protein